MSRQHDSREPKDWLQFAEADLASAEHVLSGQKPCPYWIVAYHAQQCAEKALKAFLISREQEYEYSHDLRLLMDSCEQAGADWVARVRPSEKIMTFSVVAKYPSRIRKVSKADAELAVRLARDVLNAVSGAIEHRKA